MTKDEQISEIIIKQLNSNESQEKYLNFLNLRIQENRKAINALSTIMMLTVFAFPLIVETKISEISVGPFKLNDNSFAISIIPSIFAFCYYKYATIWIEIGEQKIICKKLTSKIFSIEDTSYLNERLKPFSFGDSVLNYNLQVKFKNAGCILGLFWLPTLIVLMLFPFIFECYTVKKLFIRNGLNNLFDWLFFLTPGVIGIFTLMIYIQGGKKLDEKRGFENEKL